MPNLTDFNKSIGVPTDRMISPLAEDIASFAKKGDSYQDLRSGDSLQAETKTKTTDSIKISANFKLESLQTKVKNISLDEEETIANSLLLSFSQLRGSYLIDFSKAKESVPSPVLFQMDKT